MARTNRFCFNSLLGAAVAFLALVSQSAIGEDDANIAPPRAETASATGQIDNVGTQAEVLRKIHLINQLEIKAGNLAKEKGYSRKVRRYGERLVKDHSKADRKVQETAKSENIEISAPIASVDDKMNDKEKNLMSKLESMNGVAFDKTFAEEMDSAHQDAIASLKAAEDKFHGTKTARLISELLPKLAKHERIAEKIEKRAE